MKSDYTAESQKCRKRISQPSPDENVSPNEINPQIKKIKQTNNNTTEDGLKYIRCLGEDYEIFVNLLKNYSIQNNKEVINKIRFATSQRDKKVLEKSARLEKNINRNAASVDLSEISECHVYDENKTVPLDSRFAALEAELRDIDMLYSHTLDASENRELIKLKCASRETMRKCYNILQRDDPITKLFLDLVIAKRRETSYSKKHMYTFRVWILETLGLTSNVGGYINHTLYAYSTLSLLFLHKIQESFSKSDSVTITRYLMEASIALSKLGLHDDCISLGNMGVLLTPKNANSPMSYTAIASGFWAKRSYRECVRFSDYALDSQGECVGHDSPWSLPNEITYYVLCILTRSKIRTALLTGSYQDRSEAIISTKDSILHAREFCVDHGFYADFQLLVDICMFGIHIGDIEMVKRNLDHLEELAITPNETVQISELRHKLLCSERKNESTQVVDATYFRNDVSFANHSDRPNCEVIAVECPDFNVKVPHLVAITNIPMDQEITINYGNKNLLKTKIPQRVSPHSDCVPCGQMLPDMDLLELVYQYPNLKSHDTTSKLTKIVKCPRDHPAHPGYMLIARRNIKKDEDIGPYCGVLRNCHQTDEYEDTGYVMGL